MEYPGAGQRVEQRRLPGVRVAHERDRGHERLLPPLAQMLPPLASTGDRRLGGHDWTMELVEMAAETKSPR